MKTTRTSVRTGAKAAHEVTGSRRKRISIQLARYGVVAALVLGIFMSAAQIVQDCVTSAPVGQIEVFA